MADGIIIGVEGMYRSSVIGIKSGETLGFGRDAAVCNIVIECDAAKVSRKHCDVTYTGDSSCFVVADYSSNGTFINGKNVGRGQSKMVASGSRMSLGNDLNSFLLGAPLDDQTTIGLLGNNQQDGGGTATPPPSPQPGSGLPGGLR